MPSLGAGKLQKNNEPWAVILMWTSRTNTCSSSWRTTLYVHIPYYKSVLLLTIHKELKKLGEDYRKGELLTGEVCFSDFPNVPVEMLTVP
jgi:hypothetical protein